MKDRIIVILAISAASIGGEALTTGSISAGTAIGLVLLATVFYVVAFFIIPEILKRASSRRPR